MLNAIHRRRRKRRFKGGNWGSALLLEARHSAEKSSNVSERLHFLTLHRALGPLDDELLAALPGWTSHKQSATSLQLNALIASLLESSGDTAQASEIARKLAVAHMNYLRGYPCLLALLDPAFYHETKSLDLIDKAKSLTAKSVTFKQWLAQRSATSVAVVGNASVELGKGRGSSIDAADSIIRFNNVVTDEATQADYGSKTDLWMISPSYPFEKSQPSKGASNEGISIAISGYEPFKRKNFYWQKLDTSLYKNIVHFPTPVWHQLVSELEAPPTAGLLCLRSLDVSQIAYQAYGFTSLYNTHASNHYADKHKRSSRHNWQREAKLIAELLAHQ